MSEPIFGPIDEADYSRLRTRAARRAAQRRQIHEEAEERKAQAQALGEGYPGDLDPANQQVDPAAVVALAEKAKPEPYRVRFLLHYREEGRAFTERYWTEEELRQGLEILRDRAQASQIELYRQEGPRQDQLIALSLDKPKATRAAKPAEAPAS